MQPADLVVMDTVEHISEPYFGIDAVVFAGSEEGVDHGGTLGRFVRATKAFHNFSLSGRGNDPPA